jgi:hypothetical protein
MGKSGTANHCSGTFSEVRENRTQWLEVIEEEKERTKAGKKRGQMERKELVGCSTLQSLSFLQVIVPSASPSRIPAKN